MPNSRVSVAVRPLRRRDGAAGQPSHHQRIFAATISAEPLRERDSYPCRSRISTRSNSVNAPITASNRCAIGESPRVKRRRSLTNSMPIPRVVSFYILSQINAALGSHWLSPALSNRTAKAVGSRRTKSNSKNVIISSCIWLPINTFELACIEISEDALLVACWSMRWITFVLQAIVGKSFMLERDMEWTTTRPGLKLKLSDRTDARRTSVPRLCWTAYLPRTGALKLTFVAIAATDRQGVGSRPA